MENHISQGFSFSRFFFSQIFCIICCSPRYMYINNDCYVLDSNPGASVHEKLPVEESGKSHFSGLHERGRLNLYRPGIKFNS